MDLRGAQTVLSVAGLKGIMNEFELTLMRQRSLAAIWQKARRGEYQCRIPVGFCWTEDGRIELDPDRRVQLLTLPARTIIGVMSLSISVAAFCVRLWCRHTGLRRKHQSSMRGTTAAYGTCVIARAVRC